jgi:hypothetical protein
LKNKEEVVELPQPEIRTEAPALLAVEEAKEIPMAPAPTATGNASITILKHSISIVPVVAREEEIEYGRPPTPDGVELVIRNVSGSTMATAVFEAIFYDEQGNVLDTVRHREIELLPDTSRALRINSSISEHDQIKSYAVELIRTAPAAVEKVQLRRHDMTTTETGEEEIVGVVKNLSDVKTDAAVVANFYDPHKENIGTRVVFLREIEPNGIRKYNLKFKPQEGDIVRTYTLQVGDIVE